MNCTVSLKTLFEAGIACLKYGGIIEHTNEDGNDYYDLRRNDNGMILLCDGETLIDGKWYRSDKSCNDFFVGTAKDSGAQIYLSKNEFNLAVFE